MTNPITTFVTLLLLAPTPLLAKPATLAPALVSSCQGAVGGGEGVCAPSLDGQMIPDSKQMRSSILLLHFWATWCEPCRDELVLLAQLAKRLHGSKVEIVTVSLDTEMALVERFFKELGLPSPTKDPTKAEGLAVLLDNSRLLASRYGTFKVPETFIIGKDGKILDRVVGSYPWNDTLVANYLRLLGKTTP